MIEDKEISVVILNFNGIKHLKKYIPDVINYSPTAQIVIIDNASTDQSVSYIESTYPEIKIINNAINHGFAEGYNQGLKQVKSKYYILLNNDVRVSENWISPLKKAIDKNKLLAGCQPKILSDRAPEYFEHAGACGGYIDKDYYPFCRGRIFDEIEKDNGQYNENAKIFWCSGAAFFIRAEVFHKAGGFDSSFFAHMEEIDLCWRIQNLGYQFEAIPKSIVYHYGGGTLNYDSSSKIYLNFRNNLYMIYKNHNGFLLPKLFRRMSLDLIAALKFLISGKFNFFFSIFLSHMSFYSNLISLSKKRKMIDRKKTKELIGFYKKSILFDYFLKKRKTFNDLEI